jgi:hypothetical protein
MSVQNIKVVNVSPEQSVLPNNKTCRIIFIRKTNLLPLQYPTRLHVPALRSLALSLSESGWVNVHLARKNSPEMFRASQRTTTIFCPLSSCLATVLARRPRRCPLPSMTWFTSQPESRVRHCHVAEIQHWQRWPQLPTSGRCVSCNRKVRTMTGSKVDMVSNPGVVLEVSCRGRSRS